MIKYGKTEQFRDVIRNLTHAIRYKGLNEAGEPIYSNEPLPTLPFRGTIKLHGTNAAISWNPIKGITCQSRNNVVTDGHFGFPEMIAQEREEVENLIGNAIELVGGLKGDEHVTIFGEWVGPGVQNGVAIAELPLKTWFIFAIKYTDSAGKGHWLKEVDSVNCNSSRIKNLYNFSTFNLDIDLNNPALSQNELIRLTEEVEKQCPVAFVFGIRGIGEGIVWETWHNGDRHNFKVKGELHASSKVSTLAPVDEEKAKSIVDFVEYAVTVNRVKQAMFEVSQEVGELSKKHTGQIINWVSKDVIEEERETMKSSLLEWSNISSRASDKIRRIFFDFLDSQ